MPLASQVTSLELAKELKESGVSQNSAFYWVRSHASYRIVPEKEVNDVEDLQDICSAFTIAECGRGGVSDTQRYKCLGNAVTANVIQAIVERLLTP